MKEKINNISQTAAFFDARLDEIRMGDCERLKAKAHLARAEAIVEVLATITDSIGRLLRALTRLLRVRIVRPFRRLTATLG